MDLRDYLKMVTESGASDLYLTTGAPATLRINTELHSLEDVVLTAKDTETIARKMMSSDQQAAFQIKPELNLAVTENGERFRVNVFRQRGDVGLVIRSIKSKIPTLEELNMPHEVLQKLALLRRGLILFVGATSSGKSSSLASLIEYRNIKSRSHIITIEDPLEFIHENHQSIVEQREVGFDTDSYQDALENTLRQAPDVILIGEIRTAETMKHAITFAETGHLCLSTLHANNANQAINRILSFFPQEQHHRVLLELSLNLRAIVSQRLIPNVEGGLIPAVEVMLDSPLIRDLILKGKVELLKDCMGKSEHDGMQTFDAALFHLYQSGKITLDDALSNADSVNNLRLRISLEMKEGGEKGKNKGDDKSGSSLSIQDDPDEHG